MAGGKKAVAGGKRGQGGCRGPAGRKKGSLAEAVGRGGGRMLKKVGKQTETDFFAICFPKSFNIYEIKG